MDQVTLQILKVKVEGKGLVSNVFYNFICMKLD